MTYSNLQFCKFLKGSSPALFLGEAPTHADIIKILNFLLQLTSQWSVSKTIGGFFTIFIVKEIMMF